MHRGHLLHAGTSALTATLGKSLELPDDDVRAGLYTALLLHAGCVGYAHETARDFGDDNAFNRAAMRTDPTRPQQLFTTFLPTLTRERSPLQTVQLTLVMLTRGKRHGEAYATTVRSGPERRCAVNTLTPSRLAVTRPYAWLLTGRSPSAFGRGN